MQQQTVARMLAFSRTVRVMTMSFVVTLIVGSMTIYMFWSLTTGAGSKASNLRFAETGCDSTNNYCAPTDTGQLRQAIDRQERQGRSCSAVPALTDSVLFQWSEDLSVDVLSFDEALDAGSKKLGWVQRYCT